MKAVTLALPEVLSRCGTSVELAVLLEGTWLTDRPSIKGEWPDGEWETLVYDMKQACEAYCNPVSTCKPVFIGDPPESWNTMIGRLGKCVQHSLGL